MPRAYKENDENKIIDCTLAFLFVENERKRKNDLSPFITADLIKESRQNFEVGNHRKYAVLAATRRGPLNLNI